MNGASFWNPVTLNNPLASLGAKPAVFAELFSAGILSWKHLACLQWWQCFVWITDDATTATPKHGHVWSSCLINIGWMNEWFNKWCSGTTNHLKPEQRPTMKPEKKKTDLLSTRVGRFQCPLLCSWALYYHDKISETVCKVGRFLLAQGFRFQRIQLMVAYLCCFWASQSRTLWWRTSPWWRKAAHLMVSGKQRKKEGQMSQQPFPGYVARDPASLTSPCLKDSIASQYLW